VFHRFDPESIVKQPAGTRPSSRDIRCPSCAAACRPRHDGGRRKGRAPAGPHGPRAAKKHAAEPQVQPRSPGLPCATVLTLIRALPGDRRSCPRVAAMRVPRIALGISRRGNARSAHCARHQHRDARTTRFRVRATSFVRAPSTLRHFASIASHLAYRGDRDAPLLPRRDVSNETTDLGSKSRIILKIKKAPARRHR
jgi:hypothetical protein